MDKWDNAKCLSVDIASDDIFFSDDPVDQFEATEYCNGTVDGIRCELREQCLRFALQNKVEYGVFGGMSPISRAALLKKFKKNTVEWKWMTEKEALKGLSDRTIDDIRKRLDLA